jgi:hypothetical protein
VPGIPGTLPNVTENDNTLPGNLDFADVADPDIEYYEIYWGTDPTGTTVVKTGSSDFDPGTLASSGIYYLRARAKDLGGNYSPWTTIMWYDLDIGVFAYTPGSFIGACPTVFSPQDGENTIFFYDVAPNRDVVIRIYDLNGSLVWKRNFSDGEAGANAGANQVVWDGTNDSGQRLGNGAYMFYVMSGKKLIIKGKVFISNK